MPVAVFDTGIQTGAADVDPRQLIPGIEPGGSQAGQALKAALLIKDAWAELVDIVDAGTAPGFQQTQVRLKLSQEDDLSPGLVLPVANLYVSKTGTAQEFNAVQVEQIFRAQGSIWAPRVVGIGSGGFVGGLDSVRWRVFLDYERIEIPWMDWFLLWDWLDNVTNDSFEY